MHGDLYDYSLVNYTTMKTSIIIICSIHGKFSQIPACHLRGSGCHKCFTESRKTTLEQFILNASEIHENKYDYSIVNYITARIKISIICKIHGIFEQVPDSHLKGFGCSKCGYMQKTTEQFIEEATKKHGTKYDYSQVIYKNTMTKIIIICAKHGHFKQYPHHHLDGSECSKCIHKGFSKKQIAWLEYIAKRDNIYIQHAMNDGEYRVGKYKVDGYCKETNTCYEFSGSFYHGNPHIYKHFDINPLIKRTYGDLYISTLEKQVYIMNQGYIYESIWEDEWDAIVKNNQQQ